MSDTIEELEGRVWNEPNDSSGVITKSHRLRRKPIDEFTVEDLRFMITQNVGTEHLMPKVLALLESNALIEDYHYPGELLVAVIGLPSSYWRDHRDHAMRTANVADTLVSELERRQVQRAQQPAFLPGNDPKGKDKHEAWLLRLLTSFLAVHLYEPGT